MNGEEDFKALLRQALSHPESSKNALSKLISSTNLPPPAFVPHLVSYSLSIVNAKHLHLCLKTLGRVGAIAPESSTSEKLKSQAARFRKFPTSPRHAVTGVKVASVLLSFSGTSSASLQLLLASIVAAERIVVPQRGPQRRSKHKALALIYSHATKTIAHHLAEHSKTLFDSAKQYSKYPDESVVAIALLSSCKSRLSDEEISHLTSLICTVCLKVPQHSAHIVRLSYPVLKEISSDLVTKSFMPLIEKSLVREPQTALTAVSHLLTALSSLDLSSAIVKSILPALIHAVKSTEASVRTSATSLARAIGLCVCCEDSLHKILTDLTSILPASRYVYQRIAIYDAIDALLTTAPYFTNVNNLVLDSLRSWLESKKEAKEDARYSCWKTLLKVYGRMCNEIESSSECSVSARNFAVYLQNVLDGKSSEFDQRIALTIVAELPKSLQLPESAISDSFRLKLTSFVLSPSKTFKHDVILHAITILCTWAGNSTYKCGESSFPSKVASIIGDPSLSPVLGDSKSFQSSSDALCAIRCCIWMVSSGHEHMANALKCLLRFCLDDRAEVRRPALHAIQSVQKCANPKFLSTMFSALWTSQFSGLAGYASEARSRDFDDGMRFSERLGHTLLSTVLPNLLEDEVSRIILAANHPRLCSYPIIGLASHSSRYWNIIECNLGSVSNEFSNSEHNDWLGKCIDGIFGSDGLLCTDDVAVQAALNSLAVLSDEHRSYSTRVVREVEVKLHALVAQNELTKEGFDALKAVEESDMTSENAGISAGNIHKSNIKRGNSSKQSLQEKQAQADRARAAAANATALAEKVEKLRGLAERTKTAVCYLRSVLAAITVIADVASSSVHNLMVRLLSLVMPLVRFEALERPCRSALVSLSRCGSKALSYISMDISACLYEVEHGNYPETLVKTVLNHLKTHVLLPLSAEDFVLVSPIIRTALLKDPSVTDNMISGRRNSRRRESIGLVKIAAELLLEHCSPNAVDAAVAAAADSAGLWLISVLEREDSAFAIAADALALLTGTALTPGTELLGQTIHGLLSGKSSVRDATLAALSRLPPLSSPNIACPRDPALGRALWLARFDPDDTNAEIADELWTNYGHPLYPQEDAPIISELLSHEESDIRTMSAKSLAAALVGKDYDSICKACMQQMFQTYDLHLPRPENEEKTTEQRRSVPPPIKRGKDKEDGNENLDRGWFAREGVALGFEEMALAKCLNSSDLTTLFSFLTRKSLGDENDSVRAQMATAAFAIVKAAGSLSPIILLPLIEKQLNIDTSSMAKDEIVSADRTRENLVMCLGSVAGFLAPEDPRVLDISDRVLASAIETPSEVVQNAASRCLVSLSGVAVKGEREVAVTKLLLDKIWNKNSTYGQRRGAAYALAGVSSGLGLRFFKRAMLMTEINNAFEEKSPWRRQGAFLLIETSALMMGRVFEPYVVNIVPFLLSSMSDPIVDVRHASWAAAQAAMSELSSQGVKMVLPSLVVGLKDRQWRTRSGSADVLGAMAFCAPRQLAQCLPQVVPKLAEALADAHPTVIQSAESAINRIAAVVRSPEVRNLSPFLLAALRDPAGKTRGAIDAMLGSEFVHVIDAASLALLIPPLHRGLRDRSSELKKRSAAIVGSMCNNVSDHSDVVPYLDLLLPALRVTLLDAIPDVRRTSAKALGALAVSLGEKGLLDIVPWLMSALLGNVKSNDFLGDKSKAHSSSVSSSAERSGAAMGLAEITASMSEKRLEEVLSRVLMAGQSSAEAREGGLMLIASMPRALGDRFEGRIGTSLAAILQGLADDADIVREAALEAGRNLVSAYAKSSLDLLLPELLNAMKEKLWRIRQAATRLLGDLLLVIAGARPERPDIFGAPDANGNDNELNEGGSDEGGETEHGDGEEDADSTDENFESPEDAAAAMTVEAAMNVIEEVLGVTRRNEILAALYIARCDVSIRVRQTAMQVWKSVVSNTPRVLREIMPTAVRQIVDGLGDEDEERRGAAGKTLADLALKLGEHVVPEILPALRTGIISKTNSARIRRGACEGLGELVFACSKQQLEMYADDFIDAVYQGLRDDLADVRRIAASVFSSLLKPLGTTAVDAIVPRLIEVFSKEDLTEDDTEIALDGLTQILKSCGSRLTSIVVPRLVQERPLTAASCKVLSTAARVSGSAFEPFIPILADAVLETAEDLDTSEINQLDEVLASLSFCGDGSLKEFISQVVSKFNEGYSDHRIAAGHVFQAFCRSVDREQIVSRIATLTDMLIRQLADTDARAASASWEALKQLSDTVGSIEMSKHIPIIRQSLRAVSSGINIENGSPLLGLQIPRSLSPFIPALTEALLNGPPEAKEQSALCISELVDLTNLESLTPFVVKLTGPLIRSLSGRVPWQVKAAVLKALHELIKKAPNMVRSFVPQLQGSFVKNLSDNSRLVRNRACAGLIVIIPLQNRLEPLINDLLGLALNGSSAGSRSTAFRGCAQVFRLGTKLPSSLPQKYGSRICEGLLDEDEDVRKVAVKCLGHLASTCTSRDEYKIILDIVHGELRNEDIEMVERASIIRGIGTVFSAGKDIEHAVYDDIEECAKDVVQASESTIAMIKCAACETMGELIMMLWSICQREKDNELLDYWQQCVLKLTEMGEDPNSDVRVAALKGLKEIVEVEKALQLCVGCLIAGAGSANSGIREEAENAMSRAFLESDGEGLIQKVRLFSIKGILSEEDGDFLERKIGKLSLVRDLDIDRD